MLVVVTRALWELVVPRLFVMSLPTAALFLALLVAVKAVSVYQWRLSLLPPGPSGVPILGYLPYLTRNIHLQLTDLARQFGSVYKLYFGRHLVVVLADAKVIRQAFRQEAFSGRPNTQFTKLLDGYGDMSRGDGRPRAAAAAAVDMVDVVAVVVVLAA
ncbi:unnamed protein product [Notodromas monacha]|uniref:Cytochrome P450 n=1 Tax=Notodromas monacha TaxID=399045 RepID=A0A7R9GE24_9CRUS|nr:unnamed protein product [Notodromas monacha]CAG0919313.1 unnamed protein product [Notodromas monacha]